MAWYREVIDTSDAVRLNYAADSVDAIHWMVCLEVDRFDEESRARFMSGLREAGIDSRPYFCALSSLPMFSAHGAPVAQRKAVSGLNLPTFIELTREDVKRIGSTINQLLREEA